MSKNHGFSLPLTDNECVHDGKEEDTEVAVIKSLIDEVHQIVTVKHQQNYQEFK